MRPAVLCLLLLAAPATAEAPRTGPCAAAWGAAPDGPTAEAYRNGPDPRLGVEACDDPGVGRNARATVALLHRGANFAENPSGGIALRPRPFGPARDVLMDRRPGVPGSGRRVRAPVCPAERFADRSSYAYCSGVLVSPDTVLTAAHCLERLGDEGRLARDLLVLLDLRADDLPPDPLSADRPLPDHPRLRRVAWTLAFKSVGGVEDAGHDLGIVRLATPVPGRAPAALPPAGDAPPAPGRALYALGHPHGLPMVLTPGGAVTGGEGMNRRTDLPLFPGDSGGPIFDAATHGLLGVLSRGGTDWFHDPRRDCATSRCAEAADPAWACAQDETFTPVAAMPPFLRDLLDPPAAR